MPPEKRPSDVAHEMALDGCLEVRRKLHRALAKRTDEPLNALFGTDQ